MTDLFIILFKQVVHLNLNLAVGVLLAWLFLGRRAGPRTAALVWGCLLVRVLLEPLLFLEKALEPMVAWGEQGWLSIGLGFGRQTLVVDLGLGQQSMSAGDLALMSLGASWCAPLGALLFAGLAFTLSRRCLTLYHRRGSGPGLVWSDSETGPCLDGWWNPAIVLPRSLPRHLEATEIEAVLAHERAHLARRDHLLFALLYLLRGAVWCLWPLVIILDSLEQAVEQLCDRRAAREVGPLPLARALVKVSTLSFKPRVACAGFDVVHLENRLRNLRSGVTVETWWRTGLGLLLIGMRVL